MKVNQPTKIGCRFFLSHGHWASELLLGSIGVLFCCFDRNVDGDSWFTWWFFLIYQGNPSICPRPPICFCFLLLRLGSWPLRWMANQMGYFDKALFWGGRERFFHPAPRKQEGFRYKSTRKRGHHKTKADSYGGVSSLRLLCL